VKDCFKTIHKNYERRGIEALSQSQVHDLIHSASTNSECNDRQFVTSVVKSFCLDTDRDTISRRKVIKGFMHLCHDNNDYESAKEVADVAISENLLSRKALRIYMTLLYNSGLYENVFIAYKTCDNASFLPKSQEDFTGFNFDTTLVMAALYQHGTDEAFRDAMELKREKIERFAQLRDRKGKNSQVSFSRGTALAGWFAVEKEKYGLAVDFLDKFGVKSDIVLNILCYAKAKSGDADGAIKDLIKSVHKSTKKWKILLSPQVMDAISEEVKYFDSPRLNENFSKLCTILDKNATLGDLSLRERVLEPIEKGKPAKFEKSEFSNYKNSHTSNEPESDDVEDRSMG